MHTRRFATVFYDCLTNCAIIRHVRATTATTSSPYCPKNWVRTGHQETAAQALKLGDISIKHESPTGGHSREILVTCKLIRDLCNKASAVASGLCLTCVREAKFSDAPCEHHELLKQCVNNDPIF
jgi:hypothetical protein